MIRSAILSSYEAYLDFEYGSTNSLDEYARGAEDESRRERLAQFPYSLMLQAALPEIDFTNRWCWAKFGPRHGECQQSSSEYPACTLSAAHCHRGEWMDHWYVKTDYDFGFNEWYFAVEFQRDRFCDNVPNLHWGENYPK